MRIDGTSSTYAIVLILIGVFTIGIGLAMTSSDPPEKSASDPRQMMLSEISASEIYQTTYDLQNFSTRYYPSPGNSQAGDYLFGRLDTMPGLEVEYQGDAHRNIIATLPGEDRASDRVFIVGAHYDSMSSDPADSPGATDNGCGDAIVLELARVMSRGSFNHTIIFAFWNAEEREQEGSRDFVAYAAKNSMKIPLYLNYDSSGYDPDDDYVLDIIYDDDTEEIAEMMTEYNAGYDLGMNLEYNVHNCSSDHLAFREEGYPAITTHSQSHAPEAESERDTVDLISPNYAKKNAQLGMLVLSEIAEIQPQ